MNAYENFTLPKIGNRGPYRYARVLRDVVPDFATLDDDAWNFFGTDRPAKYKMRRAEKNLRRNRAVAGSPDLRELTGCYANVPCYIVGSSPSLAKNARELLRVERGVVIALNAAVRGIPILPDYFFFADYAFDLARWLGGVETEDVSGVFSATCHYSAARFPWREAYYFNYANNGPVAQATRRRHPELACLAESYEVAFPALHFAYLAGCDPIVLVGNDHCLAGDGAYHVNPDDPFNAGKTFELTDVHGRNVWTTGFLANAAARLTVAARFLGLAGRTVINATEGGILKYCMRIARLGDVIDEHEFAADDRTVFAGVQRF